MMERQGNTMSGAYIEKNRTGAKPPVSHPQNCKEECPYGYDKAFWGLSSKDNPDFEIVTMRGIGYKVVKK